MIGPNRVTELAWLDQAACKDLPTHIFFPEDGYATSAARAVCAVCPVRQECLDYALDNREEHGVWGGRSARERRDLRRTRPRTCRGCPEPLPHLSAATWCPTCSRQRALDAQRAKSAIERGYPGTPKCETLGWKPRLGGAA